MDTLAAKSPQRIQPTTARPLRGILMALGATLAFSVNDVAIKELSGSYALHQVILIRALIGLSAMVLIAAVFGKGLGALRTTRLPNHALRVGFVVLSNLCFFTGLAAMPYADAIAVAYIGPVAVTLMSAILLREQVGPRRWAAVLIGLLGVVVMLRPGSGVFQIAAVLVFLSAIFYAAGNLMARQMRATESALTLSIYVQIGFALVCTAMGLWAGDGHLATDDPVWGFLFRPWVWPPAGDWPILIATGLAITAGGLMIVEAYRSAEAGLVAPFEYIGMPIAIVWGLLAFGTWPDGESFVGIALICGAGLYTLWREAVRRRST
jgi:drug/metabolite transporter (DMT)-like permease